jgi:hypothetical protein
VRSIAFLSPHYLLCLWSKSPVATRERDSCSVMPPTHCSSNSRAIRAMRCIRSRITLRPCNDVISNYDSREAMRFYALYANARSQHLRSLEDARRIKVGVCARSDSTRCNCRWFALPSSHDQSSQPAAHDRIPPRTAAGISEGLGSGHALGPAGAEIELFDTPPRNGLARAGGERTRAALRAATPVQSRFVLAGVVDRRVRHSDMRIDRPAYAALRQA